MPIFHRVDVLLTVLGMRVLIHINDTDWGLEGEGIQTAGRRQDYM